MWALTENWKLLNCTYDGFYTCNGDGKNLQSYNGKKKQLHVCLKCKRSYELNVPLILDFPFRFASLYSVKAIKKIQLILFNMLN